MIEKDAAVERELSGIKKETHAVCFIVVLITMMHFFLFALVE